MSDEKNKDAVENLVGLIGDLMVARQANNNAAKRDAIDALHEFADKTTDRALRTKVLTIITVSSIDDMNKGLERVRKIVDELSLLLPAIHKAGAVLVNSGAESPAFLNEVLGLDKAMESLLKTMRRISYT